MTDPHQNESPDNDLDRLLRRAAPGAGERAPAGFADAVMRAVELDAAPPGPSARRWLFPAGLAAAAMVAGSFFVGDYFGSENAKARLESSDLTKAESPSDLTARGEPRSIEEAMRRAAKNGIDESGGVKSERVKGARDEARLSPNIPSTLASRFPRSSDGRFYLTVDRKAADLPRALDVAYLLHEAPAGLGLPAVQDMTAHRVLISAADGHKLLTAWDAMMTAELRPQMRGFEGLAPVVGVVTPPRIDESRPATAKQGAGSVKYTDPNPKPAEPADVVEIVVYVKR